MVSYPWELNLNKLAAKMDQETGRRPSFDQSVSSAIDLSSTLGKLVVTGDLRIVGGYNVTIDGGWSGGTNTDGISIFNVANTSAAIEVTMENLTLTDANGGGLPGGAIQNEETLTLNNVTITNSIASTGGGIYNYSSAASLELNGVEMTGNTASQYYGGAIANLNGDVTIGGESLLMGNSANLSGGAIASDGGALRIDEGTILRRNTAGDSGGALLVGATTTAVIRDSHLQGNTSDDEAGAIYCLGELTMINSVVVGNHAVNNGGGILADGASADLTLTNCTIAYNESDNSTSGLYIGAGSLTADNTAITANTGGTANLVIVAGVTVTANDNYTNAAEPGFVTEAQAGTSGWGSSDDNYGDLRPDVGSSLIDAGGTSLPLDEDGNDIETDILGDDRKIGDNVDIGAYEYSA